MRRLLAVGFICKVLYPKWISNIVIIKKKSNAFKQCVDFTKLNLAYLKDSFPLPPTNSLVNAISRYNVISFLDAYFGYNQILMNSKMRRR